MTRSDEHIDETLDEMLSSEAVGDKKKGSQVAGWLTGHHRRHRRDNTSTEEQGRANGKRQRKNHEEKGKKRQGKKKPKKENVKKGDLDMLQIRALFCAVISMHLIFSLT